MRFDSVELRLATWHDLARRVASRGGPIFTGTIVANELTGKQLPPQCSGLTPPAALLPA